MKKLPQMLKVGTCETHSFSTSGFNQAAIVGPTVLLDLDTLVKDANVQNVGYHCGYRWTGPCGGLILSKGLAEEIGKFRSFSSFL